MAMTKTELRAALRRAGFSIQEFADEFGVTVDTVYRWGGSVGVPRWASTILALIDQHGRGFVLPASRPPIQSALTRLPPPVGTDLSAGLDRSP